MSTYTQTQGTAENGTDTSPATDFEANYCLQMVGPSLWLCIISSSNEAVNYINM